MRKLVSALTVAAVSLAGMLAGATPATAAPVTPAAGPVATAPMLVPMSVPSAGGACVPDSQVGSSLLANNRWGSSTSTLHSRLGGSIFDDWGGKLDRQQSSLWMTIGNFLFSTAGQIVEGASRMCFLDQVGASIDNAAAAIGGALVSSPILALAVALSLVGMVAARAKQGGQLTVVGIIKKVAVIALLAAMIAGAGASKTVGDRFEPGKMSPGWFVTRIDGIISGVASMPVATISDYVAAGKSGLEAPGGDITVPGGSVLSCQRYGNAMRDLYKKSYGGRLTTAAATAPLLVSSLWEQSGMQAWKKTQFGANSGDYPDYVYCRYLEIVAQTPMDYQTTTGGWLTSSTGMATVQSTAAPGLNREMLRRHANATAWKKTLSEVDQDKQILAWAACSLSDGSKYEDRSGWSLSAAGTAITRPEARDNAAENCYQVFNEDNDGALNAWDWSGDAASISRDTDYGVAGNFINAWHGRAGSTTAGIAYALSGVAILAVFGILGGGIVVAKLYAIVLMALLFLSMVATLLTNNENRVIGFAKQYVGISLFSWMAQLVLALVALLSSAMLTVLPSLPGGSDGLLAMLWVGASPAVAVWAISATLKQVGMPSVFNIGGAMALGTAMSNLGPGAAGDAMLGLGSKVKAASTGQKLMGKAQAKAGQQVGTMKSRISKMRPGGAQPAAAGKGGLRSMLGDAAAIATGGSVAAAIDNRWDAKREKANQQAVAGARAKSGATDSAGRFADPKGASAMPLAKRRKYNEWLQTTGQSETRPRRSVQDTLSDWRRTQAENLAKVGENFRKRPVHTARNVAEATAHLAMRAGQSVAKKGGAGLGLAAAAAIAGVPGVAIAGGVMATRAAIVAGRNHRERQARLDSQHVAKLVEGYEQFTDAQAAAREAAAEAKAAAKQGKKSGKKQGKSNNRKVNQAGQAPQSTQPAMDDTQPIPVVQDEPDSFGNPAAAPAPAGPAPAAESRRGA